MKSRIILLRLSVACCMALSSSKPADGPIAIPYPDCDSRVYEQLSVSPDGQHVIASRETKSLSDCVVTTTYDIVRMRVDGTEEEAFDLENAQEN